VEKQPPSDVSRRVTLTKAQRATPAGSELIALLTELSDDGVVSRDEMARLRAWLEVERGVDFAACPFLYEVIDSIASDGEITEEELDRLAMAIERVLPPDIRKLAAEKRKQRQTARRETQRAAREAERAAAREEQARARPLHHGDFIIAGAMRSAERRDACDHLAVAERVHFEREPDNRHDANAILIFTEGGDELGYVPREDAKEMAPLMDAGNWADATVKKLLESREGSALPVVVSKMYRPEVKRPDPPVRVSGPVKHARPVSEILLGGLRTAPTRRPSVALERREAERRAGLWAHMTTLGAGLLAIVLVMFLFLASR
jgi:hypothetical protein